jgi:multidrug efflux pump subunit AcrA (membrane-fusion protein)
MAEELRNYGARQLEEGMTVANKIIGELMESHGGRFSEGYLRHRCSLATPAVLGLLVASVSLAAGCGNTNAAPAIPIPEVEVASVIQKDVPIFSEWVATLDGYVNAQIQAQVAGYVVAQNYKEGSLVRKGQILFQIDPRPFQALLEQANAQLAQAQAQLGKTEMDVGRDTPLARERAIAQSQLDNDSAMDMTENLALGRAEQWERSTFEKS